MKTEQELYRVEGHSDHHLKLFNLSVCRMYLNVSLILASKLLEKSQKVTAVIQLQPNMASGSERSLCPSISVKTDVLLSTEQIDFLVGDKRRHPFPRQKRQGFACLP